MFWKRLSAAPPNKGIIWSAFLPQAGCGTHYIHISRCAVDKSLVASFSLFLSCYMTREQKEILSICVEISAFYGGLLKTASTSSLALHAGWGDLKIKVKGRGDKEDWLTIIFLVLSSLLLRHFSESRDCIFFLFKTARLSVPSSAEAVHHGGVSSDGFRLFGLSSGCRH